MLFSVLVAAAFAAPPSVDQPLATGAKAPNDAALVIGLEDYAFLPDVRYAHRDASAVVSTLVASRGLSSEKVVRVDEGGVEVLRAALAKAKAGLGPGGRFWLYFAGHGAANPETGGLMLLGDDARSNVEAFAARGLALDGLLSELPAESVVLLDTCWSGMARGDGTAVIEGRFAVPAYVMPKQVTVLTATEPSQTAQAYEPARHGAFTYFLLGGMRGWADGALGKADGQVDLEEIKAYIEGGLVVSDLSTQRPSVSGPAVAAVTSGKLEKAPDSEVFRPVIGVVSGRTDAVLGGITELGGLGVVGATQMGAPTGSSLQLLLKAQGVEAPLRLGSGFNYIGANDRLVSRGTVQSVLAQDLEGQAALNSYRTSFMPAAIGASLLVFGGIDASLAWIPWAQVAKSNRKGLGCDEPDAIDYICINESANRVTGSVMAASTAALIGTGVALVTTGKGKRKRAEA